MLTKDAVNAFLLSRGAKGLSHQTISWYSGILNHFCTRYPILPESPSDIEEYLNFLRNKDERRHGYFRALRALYHFLERRYGIKYPMLDVEAPVRSKKHPHWLTPQELQKLFGYPHKAQIRTALRFLTDTGARVGELARLKLSDLSETPWGHLARICGKTGVRQVPISYETYHALMLTGWDWQHTTLYLIRLISKAFRDAGVIGTAHSLRHTFGTLWEGQDLIMLQRIMGHSDLSTTEIYRHLRLYKMQMAHAQYSPARMIDGIPLSLPED